MTRLGINVPNFGAGVNAQSMLDWIQFAEDAGASTAVVSDHVAPTPEVTTIYPAPFYDPLLTIAWLAARTKRIALGTSVLVAPYRHPLLIARSAAMLHEFSGGRFRLGIGTGWSRTEFEALGLNFAARGASTDATLAIAHDAWRLDHVSRVDDEFTFADVATGPRPPSDRVPVWIGGSGRRAIGRAVRYSGAWHPINPDRGWLEEVGVPLLHSTAAEAGCAAPALVPRIKLRLANDAGTDRPLGVGTVDQIADDVCGLATAGAEEVILDPNPDHPSARDSIQERALFTNVLDAVAARTPSVAP